MNEIIIGNHPGGSSSGMHRDEMRSHEFVIGTAHGRCHGDSVAYISFSAFGFNVQVYDEELVQQAVGLYRGQKFEELGTCLESMLTVELCKNPQVIGDKLKGLREEAYETGVRDGRRQKIEEFERFIAG